MEEQFWVESWDEGGFKTSFHRRDIHPYILEHLPEEKLKNKRILVPLCGKSVDLMHFRAYGDHVIGVEVVTKAVHQFFEEQNLSYTQKEQRFEADKLTMLNSDFLSLNVSEIGHIDIVYDRASLVALPLDMRLQYVKKMHELLPVGSKLFINTLEYAPVRPEPPFSVSPEEVASYYGDTHEIEHLEALLVPNHGLIRHWGLDFVKEHGFLLTKVK